MSLILACIRVRDLADLIHAVAWPLVVFYGLWQFRRSIDHAVKRIPWERTTSVKASGFGELKITRRTKIDEQITEKAVIPIGKPPSLSDVLKPEE